MDGTWSQIFVGGLDPAVGDEDLRNVFGQFGELVYVKIPAGKGCGFVQFTHRYVVWRSCIRSYGECIVWRYAERRALRLLVARELM